MDGTSWLDASELRVGLGCMRMSTDAAFDEELADETIAAAVAAGVTIFDTARAYGENERMLAQALRRCGGDARARIVTKGGMTLADDRWLPDGRAKTIRADCEASLEALDGLAIDLYLVHAPDPRTPWRTTVRALGRLLDDGIVESVGVANVSRHQLDEALALAPIAAVQVALSLRDDRAIRGGVVERCEEAGVAVIAHSPLGGPRRVRSLLRNDALAEVAAAHDATPAETALAWVLGVSPVVVAIPGARRPEAARSAARAATVRLDDGDDSVLARAFLGADTTPPAPKQTGAEVVLVIGIPGAGKSRLAGTFVDHGYTRLNRDEHAGTLRALAESLDGELASGVGRIVLDNTYLTRAARSYAVDVARRHGAAARCVWLETPLAQAQVNLVERLLERFDALPTPEELRKAARTEPGILAPTAQMRALRELEPPTLDEGFTHVERVEFVREPRSGTTGVLVAAAVVGRQGWERTLDDGNRAAPHLVFDWRPDATDDVLARCVELVAAEVSGPVEGTVCPHPAGPPVCWCRPPLPGLPLAFARRHGVDLAHSVLLGATSAHRTLATTLGAAYVAVAG